MGNNSSQTKFLEAKTKLEDYDNIPDVYRIIDPKGGGELVDLAWLAHRTHNLSLIDNYIRNEVSKYVLNDGKGEQVRRITITYLMLCSFVNSISYFLLLRFQSTR